MIIVVNSLLIWLQSWALNESARRRLILWGLKFMQRQNSLNTEVCTIQKTLHPVRRSVSYGVLPQYSGNLNVAREPVWVRMERLGLGLYLLLFVYLYISVTFGCHLVSAVQGKHCCVLWEAYETHKLTPWENSKFILMLKRVVHRYHWALNQWLANFW